jgi:formylglycine-generating enzyme required for sulfatase activity/uncharacterized caspase-like protein
MIRIFAMRVIGMMLALGLGLTPASAQQAEKRVALVIGNAAYQHVPRLDNPLNDARLMAETLRGLGFTLIGGGPQVNLDKPGFDRAVLAFGQALQGSDVGLFYYAGHGVQVRGGNYLVPVGANPTREADVDFQMLDANLVLRQMEGAGTKLNLMVLDACRNNPFAGRGLRATDGGLAQMRAPEGTLISFATQPGGVAQDGDGGNSPYTRALVQAMKKPGLDIFRTFNEVGLAVSSATGGAQQPWVSLSPIKGDFYFSDAPATIAAPPSSEAERAWALIKDTTNVAVLEAFINQFSSTVHGAVARARIDELRQAQAAPVAPVQPPPQVSMVVPPVQAVTPPPPAAQPAVSEAERAWALIKDTTNVAVLEAFINQFGSTNHGAVARARLDELRKEQAAPVAQPVQPPPQVSMLVPPAQAVPPPPPAAQPAVAALPDAPGVRPSAPERERALNPKDVFKDCDACPEMIVVPAGSFTMGSPAKEGYRDNGETQHPVTFARPFAVGKFATTFAEWDACVADGGCNGYRPEDQGWGRGKRPVVNVGWDDAQAYVAWLSKKTGRTYRLLSEAEREYVTRAGTTGPFWWGSSMSTRQANYDATATPYGNSRKGEFRQRTVAVDSFQPNPWGLYQVHGNVWEWTEDCWNDNYNGAPADGSAWTAGDCSRRVLRGGSWYDLPWQLRSAHRLSSDPTGRNEAKGFRVARTLE